MDKQPPSKEGNKMKIQRTSTCLSFIICKYDASNTKRIVAKETKLSEDKRKITSRMTSFQALCRRVISETRTQNLGHNNENKGIKTTNNSRYNSISVSTLAVASDSLSNATLTTEQADSELENTDVTVNNTTPNSDSKNDLPPIECAATFEPTERTTPLAVLVISESSDKKNPAEVSSKSSSMEKFTVTEQTEIRTPFTTIGTSEIEEKQNSDKDQDLQEYVSVVVQAAAKKFSAKKELSKTNKFVKGQSFLHNLARKEALGAFRYAQPIFRIQRLVKARHHYARKKLSKKLKADSKTKEPYNKKSNESSYSTLKLLSNVLSNQISELKPKTKSVPVNYDPVKPASAWQLLEYCMSHNYNELVKHDESISSTIAKEEEKLTPSHEAYSVPATISVSIDSQTSQRSQNSSSKQVEVETERPTSSHGLKLETTVSFKDLVIKSLENISEDQVQKDNVSHSDKRNKVDSIQEPIDLSSTCATPHTETESVKSTTRREVDGEFENAKQEKSPDTLKMLSNLETAIQSTIEKLSSPQAKQISSADDNLSPKHGSSSINTEDTIFTAISSLEEPIHKTTSTNYDYNMENKSIKSYVEEAKQTNSEIGVNEKRNATSNAFEDKTINQKEQVSTYISYASLPLRHEGNGESTFFTGSTPVEQHAYESNTAVSNITNPRIPLISISSSQGSPKTQCQVLTELHGMKSNQITVSPRYRKLENKILAPKPRPQLVGKNSQAITRNDGEGSIDHSPVKSSIKRNSFGISKTDQFSQDARFSNSNSNIVPNYMQTTESTRAKFHIDLKSIPDVDKDHGTKRHSLYVEHGRMVAVSSPRMQKSSQT